MTERNKRYEVRKTYTITEVYLVEASGEEEAKQNLTNDTFYSQESGEASIEATEVDMFLSEIYEGLRQRPTVSGDFVFIFGDAEL